MGRATWLADVLTDAGLTVKPHAGWETRGIDSFTPRGVMWHHTVTRPTTADPSIDHMLAVKGSSKVPPPLCNYSTNRDGSISLIAAGTANHGGTGKWNGLSGNRFFFGDEMKNLGTAAEPWSGIQLESARLATAVILKHIGQGSGWLCAHKEYAIPLGRKTDPHSLNMNTERVLVAALMVPNPGDDTDMTPSEFAARLSAEQVRAICAQAGVGGVWVISPTEPDRQKVATYYTSILNSPANTDWVGFYQEVQTEALVNTALGKPSAGGGLGALSIQLTGTGKPI